MDHAGEAQRTDLMTITRHVLNEQSKHPEAHGNFTILLTHIVLGCKFVCNAVTKAGLAKLIGLAGQTNTQGEEQKKLDVLSNDVFVKALISSGCTAYRTSQEPSVLKLKEPALDEITHALVGRYNLNFTRQDISSLWFLCKQEASLLNITDQACALFTPSEVVLLEWTDDLELFILKGYGNALNYQMGVPLLEDVVQSMEQAIMAKEEERAPGCYEKARLRFAHAETLLPFSCLIGLSLEESGQEFKQSIGYQLLRCSSVFDANIHTPVSQLYGEILEENGIDLAEMKVLRRKMEEIAISVNQGCTTT